MHEDYSKLKNTRNHMHAHWKITTETKLEYAIILHNNTAYTLNFFNTNDIPPLTKDNIEVH